ncbi:hypothetical protein ACFOWM_03430 [Ferruginibacter yonginensis]|uniref:Uncharacterized protein n=1 Tax=Ferruginibacter yonginensis TaxID=1310416 RepID=A0ABV8QNQ9_9BACT
MKLFKYLIAVTIMVSSCYTANKAAKQTNKAANHYPEVVAKVAKQRFYNPITKSDTVTKPVLVPYFVECPPPGEEAALLELSADEYKRLENAGQVAKATPQKNSNSKSPIPTDTSKKKGVLVNIPVTTTTITNDRKDTGEETILQAEANKLTSKLATKQQWLVVGFTLAAVFFLATIVLLFLLIKRKKNIKS